MAEGAPGVGKAATADRSVRVAIPSRLTEQAGAILMDVLGPFEEQRETPEARGGRADRAVLVFYPPADGPATRDELLALLPPEFAMPGVLEVRTADVSREWVEGWREHFRPLSIGRVRVRPPWEPPLDLHAGNAGRPGEAGNVEVVINPGLGFGTGLHPTTRGTLLLLQDEPRVGVSGESREGLPGSEITTGRGPLLDVGTGSGILAVAAAKLGWEPVVAFDNDPVALVSARENAVLNGVEDKVDIHEADVGELEEDWFRGATVVANMTLEPVTVLLRRLARATACPRRLIVSGILAGSQEQQLLVIAHQSGFTAGRRSYEAEWVSLELFPEARGS